MRFPDFRRSFLFEKVYDRGGRNEVDATLAKFRPLP